MASKAKVLDIPGTEMLTMSQVKMLCSWGGYEDLIANKPISTLPIEIRDLVVAMREGYNALKEMVMSAEDEEGSEPRLD